MNKTFKVLEIIWLLLGCIGIVLSVYFVIKEDIRQAICFLAFTVVSGLMYAVRKHQRKRMEISEKQKQ